MTSLTARRRVGNLPAELTSFVDRRQEAADVRRLLSVARVVTLTGVGGVGKTRLALRVAGQLDRVYPGGVWLVDLAQIHDQDLVVHTVAQALGIQDWSSRGVETVLADNVRDKQILVVLDNCEQVLDGCAKSCHVLLDASPELRILATSRQPLGVYGEHTMPVPALPVSEPGSADARSIARTQHAVRLFVDRASAVSAGFTLTDEQETTVRRLCHELDGIPLAIELAAARMRSLSVDELLSRISGRFRLLTSGSRTVAPRHQTLRAAMDWSYELCSRHERTLWARLSAFAGGVDLEAAAYVCATDELAGEDFLESVGGLVDKSILLRREYSTGGISHTRYELLETIREYGQELQTEAEYTATRRRHRDWFLRLAERGAEEWFGAHQFEWRARIAAEHANMRAALEYCATAPGETQAGLRMAGALWFYWEACGLIVEGRQWLDRLLVLDSRPTAARATALWVCSWLASHQGDLARGAATAKQCGDVAAWLQDPGLAAFGMHLSGVAAMAEGDLERAHALCTEAWSRHRVLDKVTSPMVMALVQAGLVASLQGETDRAVAYAKECLEITTKAGEVWTRSWGLVVLGLARWCRGEVCAAVASLRESITMKYALDDLFGLGMAVEVLAWSLVSEGDHRQAARLFGALEGIWPRVGVPLLGSPQLMGFRQRSEDQARSALGNRTFDELFQEGAALPLDQGLAFALSDGAIPEPGKIAGEQPWFPLTRREREVAELVAQGLSNKEIAAKLVISQRTAETHVEHILTKLGYTSRSQIVTWVSAQPTT